MNILQTYEFFKQIRNTTAMPSFCVGTLHESYALETAQYKLVAKASYTKTPTTYDFTAFNKSTGRKSYCSGMLAKIMFSQISKKAKQK